jgi:hypothetical protein
VRGGSRRAPVHSSAVVLFGVSASLPEGMAGFTEKNGKASLGGDGFHWQFVPPPLQGWRFWRRDVTVCENGGRAFISGRGFTLHPPWGKRCWACWKTEKLGGHSTPLWGGVWTGRQDAAPNRKKSKQGSLRFFLPLGPRLWPGGVPPPLSR